MTSWFSFFSVLQSGQCDSEKKKVKGAFLLNKDGNCVLVLHLAKAVGALMLQQYRFVSKGYVQAS